VDRRRLGGMVIVMAVTAMCWSFFGIWYGLLILGVVSLARFVERRITPQRLADVRVPRYLAVPVILLPISLAVFIVMSPNGGGGARSPDNHVSQPSATSLRAVFLVRIGPSFGGLRLAVRPGFIDWPEGFVALEGTVARVMTYLLRLAPEQRSRVLSGETPWPKELVADLGPRPGFIDGVSYPNPAGGTDVVLRGSFAFPWWPLGEWVVFQGVHLQPDNRREPFSYDELSALW